MYSTECAFSHVLVRERNCWKARSEVFLAFDVLTTCLTNNALWPSQKDEVFPGFQICPTLDVPQRRGEREKRTRAGHLSPAHVARAGITSRSKLELRPRKLWALKKESRNFNWKEYDPSNKHWRARSQLCRSRYSQIDMHVSLLFFVEI